MIRDGLRRMRSLYRRGRRRLWRSRPEWRRTVSGFQMLIDQDDAVDQAMMAGRYEPHLAAFIDAVVLPGETCVDVGTHKGFFTLQLAQRVGDAGAVLAIDPDPRAYEALCQNVARNGLSQVTPLRLALAESAGSCEIALSSQVGWTSRFPNETARPTVLETVVVETAALDDLMARHRLPAEDSTLSFVKIDAEGSEPLILSGMRGILQQHAPLLHLEVNAGSLQVAGSSAASIEALLASYGYHAFEMAWTTSSDQAECLTLQPIALRDLDGLVDVICVPPAAHYERRIARFVQQC